jgi:hypothetical protein
MAAELALDIAPHSLEIGRHRAEAASLAAVVQSLGHHQPEDYVQEEPDTLNEEENDERNANPEGIDVKGFGETSAHTAEDPVLAAVELLVVHLLHVRRLIVN